MKGTTQKHCHLEEGGMLQNAPTDSSAPHANYHARTVKTVESVPCVARDSFRNVTAHLVIPERSVNKSVQMGYGEWIVLTSVPANSVIQLQDHVDVKIRRSVLMDRARMDSTAPNAISNAVWTVPMVVAIQFLVIVPAQMVFTDKTVRSRVRASHLERTADSHANVLENTQRGVMRLPENVTANQGTMDITANECALRDCLVQDAPGSAHVQLVLGVIL